MTRFLTSGLGRLSLAMLLIAGTWLVALPWCARQPSERERWRALQDAGIDPSAMYYSELDAMQPILERLNSGRPLPAFGEIQSASTRRAR